MCLSLYIGSDLELKQIDWDNRHPALHAKELDKIPALLEQMTVAYALAEIELKQELTQLQS